MACDKAIVTVRAEHEGIAKDVREVVADLNDPDSFLVRIEDESHDRRGTGVDGSKLLTVEVHEYSGEIPVFTLTIEEEVTGAEVIDIDNVQGGSELC